jgi:O-antigen/teichoic acid export membrane protein
MGSNRQVFKHAAIYSFASIVGKAVGFIMLPFYAYILQDTGYGVMGMIDASLSFLTSLFSYGIIGGVIRIYHEEKAGSKASVISTAMILLWTGSSVAVVPMMLLSPQLSQLLLADAGYYPLFCIALVGFLFDISSQAASAILIITQRSMTFSLVNLMRLFVGILLNILFIIVFEMGLLGFFLSSLITSLLSCVVFHALAIKNCGLHFDPRIAKSLVAFELPLVPGNLISFASLQMERFLLRFTGNIGTVGVLEMGYKFPTLIPLLVTEPFMQSWTTKRTEIADRAGADVEIGHVFTQFLFLLIFVSLLLAATVQELIRILTPLEFWPAYRIARVEIITNLLFGAYYHLYFGLFYAKDTKTISLIRSVSHLAKIVLSVLFIWLWGIYGAAYSAMFAAALQFAWTAVKSQAAYPMRIEYRKIALLILVALCIHVFLSSDFLPQLGVTQAIADSVIPAIVRGLSYTPIGHWRSGALLAVLTGRAQDVALVALKATVCLSFVLLLPVVHDGLRIRVHSWIHRFMRASKLKKR